MKKKDDSQSKHLPALAEDLRMLTGKFKRRLREEVTIGDFTWSQLQVLGHLERNGPATVTALAQAEGVRSQSMGATVSILEKAGFVKGAQDLKDGRQTILSLTDKCHEMIKVNRMARDGWLLRTIQAKLTNAEQKELMTAVELLKRLVE